MINVSSFGYLPEVQAINIPDDGYLEINFNLTPDPWLEQAEIEDFETDGFNNFEWNLSGNSNWTIDSNTFIERVIIALNQVI